MKLQTKIPLEASAFQINYKSTVILLGSCFAENIGDKFSYFKFQSGANPFGILFHPKAIETVLENAVQGTIDTDKDVFELEQRWHSFNAHSSLSAASKAQLLQNLKEAVAQTQEQLEVATHIVITLGTAWVYQHNRLNSIVANCHKVPQTAFTKKLLSVSEIEASIEQMIALVQTVNTKAKFIFTVSPVRHIKDGFVENQRSKSHLITALHTVLNKDRLKAVAFYFPSYEIVMDELRDYRFYTTDMLHPNRLAVDYIWEKFAAVWIAEGDRTTMEKVAVVQRGLQHRPFNVVSDSHQKFVKALEEKIAYLQKEYPFMTF